MALYRKFNHFIFFTIAGSILSIIILGVSIGTKNWYESSADARTSIASTVTVHYGLFGGAKISRINAGNDRKWDLKIVCATGENICMFSCGLNSDTRKANLEFFLQGGNSTDNADRFYCLETPETSATSKRDGPGPRATTMDKDMFLNFALWLVTLIFLIGGMLFSMVAGTLSLVNTYRAPSQPILSVYGLYIWNGLSAACTLMVMILWGVLFGTGLKDQPAISDTLSKGWENSSSKLGYSYWILILPEILCLANIGILRYRTWKIHEIETKLRVVTDKITNHETLLF